jgi:hypothetical protein
MVRRRVENQGQRNNQNPFQWFNSRYDDICIAGNGQQPRCGCSPLPVLFYYTLAPIL